MILLLLLSGSLALVAWNVMRWPAVQPRKELAGARVSVLIPARDEAANIGECLDAVLRQACVTEVLVYDDGSSDGTSAIVEVFSRRDVRVRLLPGEALPGGWCGKTFACSRLAAQAQEEWLLFLDADARLAEGAAAGMMAEARQRSATFLSCWPGLVMAGFWEQLLMPMLNFAVFTIYPAAAGVVRREPSLGLAHGACILVHAPTYERVGGHAAVAAEVFEDTRLARIWRERGENSICLDGQHVVRARMYGSLAQIWFGFQKNFRSGFRTATAFWAFMAVHAGLFLLPFVIASPSALLVVMARVLLARRFRQPVWSAMLHPAAEGFLLALGVASWWRWRGGRGVEWKGRVYRRA